MRKFWTYCLLVLVFIFPAAEIAARIIGWKALHNNDYEIAATPRLWIKGDAELGFQLIPGSFQITLNKGLTFQATHQDDHTRWLGSANDASNQLYFFGCSFTYGYGVNDDQTFAALTQQQYPNWNIRNFAVPGYGTSQACIRLEQLCAEEKKPKVAVLVYSKVHAERDVMAFSWRKAMKIGFARSADEVEKWMKDGQFPYWNLQTKRREHLPWDQIYSNWPGRETFAIVNALQSISEKDIAIGKQQEGSRKMVQNFIDICLEQGIKPVIVDLDQSFLSPSDLTGEGIGFVEGNFQFPDKWINVPYDRHPNPEGHRIIFERIERALKPILDAQ